MELIQGEKTPGQIAKAYGVHTNSAIAWKNEFLGKGAQRSRWCARDVVRVCGHVEDSVPLSDLSVNLSENESIRFRYKNLNKLTCPAQSIAL